MKTHFKTSFARSEHVCIICLGSDPPPIQSGCLIEKAMSMPPHRGNAVSGAMRTGLAEAW
jgi:hypothetical protein